MLPSRFIITFTLFLIVFPQIHSQITTVGSKNGEIELEFHRDKIETKAKSVIFNLLKIKNNSNSIFSGKVSISLPLDWNIIGDKELDVNINSKDSINIPVRISVSKNAIGDIGYSVVAKVEDTNGKTVKSAYSFITIPRKTLFTEKSFERFHYLSKDQDKFEFRYLLKNQGNVDELVHMEVFSSENISIEGSDKFSPYIVEYSLKPNTDTTISLNVEKKIVDQNINYSNFKIQTTSSDTSYNRLFWVKILDNNYKYRIPETQKCAILELFAHNIISSDNPTYSMLFKGRILFKKDHDLYYYFRNYNIENSLDKSMNYKNYYKAYIGYANKSIDLRIGNIEKTIEQNLYGNGANLKVNFRRNKLEGVFVNDLFNRYYSSGGLLDLELFKFKTTLGGIYTDLHAYSKNTILGFGGVGFRLFKQLSVSLNSGFSQIHDNNINDDILGYGLKFNISQSGKRFKFNLYGRYGTAEYVGKDRGRMILSSNFSYKFSNGASFVGKFNREDYQGSYDIYNNNSFKFKRSHNYAQIYLSKSLNRFINYQIGPVVKMESSDQYFFTGELFQTIDSKLFLSAFIRTKYSDFNIIPRIKAGTIKVRTNELNVPKERTLFNSYDLSVNLFKKTSGLQVVFRYGPTNISENYLYYTNGYFAQWFYVMPYYSKDLFDNKMKIDIRTHYINNISANENSFNINNQLIWYFPKDFTLYFLNTFSTRARIDRSTNTKYSYNSVYFEFGVRKEFNCDQPRIKYHNLKVVFFRDLNGNRVKDENEPGINNIYVNIIKDFDLNNIDHNKEFSEAELITDQFGNVQYNNISNGRYIIKYRLLGKILGNYSLEELETEVVIDKDKTIYIPYLENNKIIGKVTLNRDPLSSLGNIDISNIRVVAKDTEGRTYSALTDKLGNFTLYTPKADHYIVSINNIFYESFDLQQSEFIVKFNGYKQFEVTFVFDEKKRTINFSNDISNENGTEMDELKVIKKTTLNGKVNDAITLRPVEAIIRIVDNKNNNVISESVSNRINGNYSISYVAGDHFRIEVIAKGYEDHIENLYIEQIISIQNLTKNILINKKTD